MKRTYIAYTRVSTVNQGAEVVLLAEQRRAISAYAATHQLTTTAWHEEITTAAKRGRHVFSQVLRAGSHSRTLAFLATAVVPDSHPADGPR